MNKKSKRTLKRSHFLFKDVMITLKQNIKFEKKFKRWYEKGNDTVPSKISDYLLNHIEV